MKSLTPGFGLVASLSLGDAAYTDTLHLASRKYYAEPNLSKVQESFDKVTNDHYYQLVSNHTKVYGIWDDHDYGLDNGGKTFQGKHVFRKLYLDFLKEPQDSPRRTRAGGIYESYFLDKEKKIKLILLDNRWALDELEK